MFLDSWERPCKKAWEQMENLLALIKIDLTYHWWYGAQSAAFFCKTVMYQLWDRRCKVDYGRVLLVTVHCLACFHWPLLCWESQWEDAPVKINFQGPVTSVQDFKTNKWWTFSNTVSNFNLPLQRWGIQEIMILT